MRWVPVLLFGLLAGCRHQIYTLTPVGRAQLLTPPVSKPEIKNARTHPAEKSGCDIEAESFSVAWHGNTARIAVKTENYYAPPPAPSQQAEAPGVSIAESGPRIYVDSMSGLESFREALAARENSGCLRGDEGARLRQSMTEKFPFPPQIAAFLRFGMYMKTGFIDLTPGFVLRVVSPAAGTPDVSFYEVKPVPGDNRSRVMQVAGAGKALTPPESPAYFRFLYWTGGSVNFRTTILGTAERGMLNDATRDFLSSPEGYCAKPGAGIFCQSVAVTVGMNAGFYVHVNGKETFVRLGGQIGEAVGDSRNGMRPLERPAVPQNVALRRMYRGKLIPVRASAGASILGLIAMPGDEITLNTI